MVMPEARTVSIQTVSMLLDASLIWMDAVQQQQVELLSSKPICHPLTSWEFSLGDSSIDGMWEMHVITDERQQKKLTVAYS